MIKQITLEVIMYIHTVKPGETLLQIARDYRVSYPTLLNANPTLTDPNVLYVGQHIIIPGYPNPRTLPYQIEVSIHHRFLRLLMNGFLLKQYPIAVGKMLNATPMGDFIVINKAPNPGGPYGTMWMSLSKEHYGIHGTNDPSSIGSAVSKGCIRMYNHDVEELARIIPIGTPVYIRP